MKEYVASNDFPSQGMSSNKYKLPKVDTLIQYQKPNLCHYYFGESTPRDMKFPPIEALLSTSFQVTYRLFRNFHLRSTLPGQDSLPGCQPVT
jgi:hypothetical protein